MQTINKEQTKKIILEYVENRLKGTDIKPLMFYSGDTTILDSIRHNIDELFPMRVHNIMSEGSDALLFSSNGDYTQKEIYVCFSFLGNEQFEESHINYALNLAEKDNKPLIYLGDKTNYPADNHLEEIFDVYEII